MASFCDPRRGGPDLRTNSSSKWIVFLIAATTVFGRAFGAAPSPNETEAQQLVKAAAEAEINGDAAKLVELLKDAVRTDPDNQLARWHLGEVRVDNKWVKVEEAQEHAASDRLLAQYGERREHSGDGLWAQLALARWCSQHNLKDEARYHWANVLAADPRNRGAQRALDLHWIRGRLMTAEQIAADKSAEVVRRRERLSASVTKWKGAVLRYLKYDGPVDEVLDDLRAIDYAEAIPVVEDFIEHPDPTKKDGEWWGKYRPLRRRLCLAFTQALVKMPEQAATEALTRQAIWSSYPDVEALAVEELKRRPRYDYVPLLIDGLDVSVETKSSAQISQDLTNSLTQYTHALTASHFRFMNAMCPNCARQFTVEPSDPIQAASFGRADAMTRPSDELQSSLAAATAQFQKEQQNWWTQVGNKQFMSVLEKTTGQHLGEDPKAWWKWWQNENDYYESPKQAAYQDYHHTVSHYSFSYSCFIKGTPVWAKTGRRAIETLREGDLVLSQNVETGELCYKPVLVPTVRPPSPILKITLEGDVIKTTKGHPFWVAGTGWRMAKELDDGAMLYGLGHSSQVRSIEQAGEAEAYNLVVGDFNTYFVGERGILVHDNTPRRPTKAKIPGLFVR